MAVKKLSFQQLKKKHKGKCFFCETPDYNVLDCHRILEGENGGKYTDFNTLVVCATCHRKVHSGTIKILGKHSTSRGSSKIVHFIDENNKEQWKYE